MRFQTEHSLPQLELRILGKGALRPCQLVQKTCIAEQQSKTLIAHSITFIIYTVREKSIVNDGILAESIKS